AFLDRLVAVDVAVLELATLVNARFKRAFARHMDRRVGVEKRAYRAGSTIAACGRREEKIGHEDSCGGDCRVAIGRGRRTLGASALRANRSWMRARMGQLARETGQGGHAER